MAIVELSEAAGEPARLEVEVAESEGLVRLWFDGVALADLPLAQATQGAACEVPGGHWLGIRVQMRVGQAGVVATLDDRPLVAAAHPAEAPGARVALAALVTIVLGVLEVVGGALVGGLNLVLILGFFTAGLGVLLHKTQESPMAFAVLLLAAATLLAQLAVLLLHLRVPIWVLVGPLVGLGFVLRGLPAARALPRAPRG